jgi:hypothetical protein
VHREDAGNLAVILAVSLGLLMMAMLFARVHQVAFVAAVVFVLLAAAIAALTGYDADTELWWAALFGGGVLLVASMALYLRRAEGHGLWTGNVGHIAFYASTVYLL